MDKFKIHMVFMYHEIVCVFFIFFQPFKKVKRILSSQAAQKPGSRSYLDQVGPSFAVSRAKPD